MFSYRCLSVPVWVNVDFKVTRVFRDVRVYLNFDLFEEGVDFIKSFAFTNSLIVGASICLPSDSYFSGRRSQTIAHAAGASVTASGWTAYANIAATLTVHLELIDIPIGVVVAGQ